MSTIDAVEGLFETMLVAGGRIVLERAHFERMARTARRIGLVELEEEVWSRATGEALRTEASSEEYGLRCIYQMDASGRWSLSAEEFDLPEVTLRRRIHGRVTILPRSIRRPSPWIKSLDWLAEVRSLRETFGGDLDEGLLSNDDGRVLEGTSTNVFAIDHDTLLTPPVEAGILPGIVRDWVICNAPQVGLTVRYRLLDHDDLLKGSFLTSSLSRISAIRQLDGTPTADPGERLREMSKLFDDQNVEGGSSMGC